MTENNWTRPNRYRAEWPLIVATYAQMAGIDGWTFFAMEDTDWRHQMGVWDLSNPSVLGQFPAAALVFRRGDVREAESPAVREQVSLDEAYGMNGTAAVPLRGSDALWEARIGDLERSAGDQGQVDPVAYFVGPVVQEFIAGPANIEAVDLEKYVDRDQQVARSLTGELAWDAKTGVMTVNTPRAQGAWGFLQAAGRIDLGDVSIESANEYGAVIVVSLDGNPIADSERVLVQTGTWDQPYGFQTDPAPDGYERITKLGDFPLNVRRIEATVEVAGEIQAAEVLDGNGYATDREVPLESGSRRTSIILPDDSLYTILRR